MVSRHAAGLSLRRRGDEVPVCDKCGVRHLTATGYEACAGHVHYDRDSYVPGQDRKRLERPRACRAYPVAGVRVCKAHGGNAAQVIAAGEDRVDRVQAEDQLRRFGRPLDVAPTETLLDTVKWTAGYVAWLRDKVAAARTDKALTQKSKMTGKREAGVWVDMLGTWHDRLVRACAEAIRAGVEERRVRIAEQQGALVAEVIRRILGDLELSDAQQALAGQSVPRHLRAIAGSPAA